MGQRTVLLLEPKRAAATLGYLIMTLLMATATGAALVYPTDAWPNEWRPQDFEISDSTAAIVAAAAALLAVACLAATVVNGRRWHTARVVERLCSDPTLGAMLPETMVGPPQQRSAVIPPLQIDVVKPRMFARPRRLRHVSRDLNVIGRPPMQIAFLRVFENQPRMRTFVQGAWREFGFVHLLCSAAAVTPAELRVARQSGDVASLFVRSEAQLRDQLARAPIDPCPKGRYTYDRIAARKIKVRDPYGAYPVRRILCHGSYWRAAVEIILDRADLVVLDLSGYRRKNEGTRYELQRIIDRVPVERVMFLADQRSSRRVLRTELQNAWSQMAPGSPNAVYQPKQALIVVTDYYRGSNSGAQGGPAGAGGSAQASQTHVRLVARRRQTRRVAAMAQVRADGYRASQPGAFAAR